MSPRLQFLKTTFSRQKNCWRNLAVKVVGVGNEPVRLGDHANETALRCFGAWSDVYKDTEIKICL